MAEREDAVLYIVTEDDLLAAADAVQRGVTAMPLQEVFSSVAGLVVEQVKASAYHALRGAQAAVEPSPGRTTALRISAPAVAADTSTSTADPAEDNDDDEEGGERAAAGAANAPVRKKYHVRKGGTDRYPDIVVNEIPDTEFDAHDVWGRLQPLVHSDSPRAFESFRRSLEKDTEKFQRLPGPGYMFRRLVARPQSVLDLLGGIRNETAASGEPQTTESMT